MKRIKKWSIGIFITVSIVLSVGFQSDFFEIAKQIDIYTTLFKELNKYYIDEINPAKITKQSVNHMLSNLDPYTRYYDEQGVEDSRIKSTGDYGGIGAVSRFSNKTLFIREIMKNSPAEKAGIKPGDKIIKVDDILVSNFDEEGISSLLNGLIDTKVKLQIERQNKVLNLEVVRKKITLNAVPFFTMLNNKTGYIAFTIFNEKAAMQVKNAYDDLKDEGMEKLIIDVRSNPGGLLNEAVKITNFFIPKGKVVVTTKAKIKQWSDTHKTNSNPIDVEIPVAILVNNRSASASEILSGSLQDYDRAVVLGERSFGKGLVQRYLPLSYGTQMKITISKYYTPSGRCIQELDYTNRDDKGNIPKFSDSGRKTYKTANGRTVYGGGGILPDVEIAKPATTETTKTLLKSDAFFDYVTTYFYNNATIAEPNKFELKTADFNNFIAYLKQHHAKFETAVERDFRKAKEKAIKNQLGKNLSQKYNNLLQEIQANKIDELQKNKDEILSKLTEEIVKRYYYIEGVYQQKAAFDKTIQQAVDLLSNTAEYNKILKN